MIRQPGPVKVQTARAQSIIILVASLVIAAIVLLPVLTVFFLAATPTENIWAHLISTTLPRYFGNTVFLMLAVGICSLVIGTTTAWLVTIYRFPLRGFFQWALVFPLGIPAYVGAYALVDFLEYAGPLQTAMRSIFGWQLASDYYFPEIRSRGGAVFALTAALYPYVYLFARAGFREQSGAVFDVARTLGAGPVARFFKVGLPLIRPGIAAAGAIVMMETVSDFGVVDYFAVQTLTTGVFSIWLDGANVGGAAQIASLVLIMVLTLVAFEKNSRRRIRFYNPVRQNVGIAPIELKGRRGWMAMVVCLFPFAAGFVLPGGVMLWHSVKNPLAWLSGELTSSLANSLWTGAVAATVTTALALLMVYGARITRYSNAISTVLPVTTMGYAVPGAVLGLGVLIPLAGLDHILADAWLRITGHDPGLLLTGSGAGIVIAYVVRFFAIPQGASDSAFGRVAPSLPMAARTLGRTAGNTLRSLYLPLIKGSVLTSVVLVFVDCVKELPATLLLRPFNFNTLATRAYERASLENIGDAAPAALLVAVIGLCGVIVLIVARR